jgi:hypothetical protein
MAWQLTIKKKVVGFVKHRAVDYANTPTVSAEGKRLNLIAAVP